MNEMRRAKLKHSTATEQPRNPPLNIARWWLALVNAWSAGRAKVPHEMRNLLIRFTLTERLGIECQPGTWEKMCRIVPALKRDPLTHAFNLGKEDSWRRAEKALAELPDPKFIRTVLAVNNGSRLLAYFRAEAEHNERAGMAKRKADRSGGKVSAQRRQVKSQALRKQVIQWAGRLLEQGRPKRELAGIIAPHYGISVQHVRRILRAAGIN